MNITRKWERVLAVGCSHGKMIDPHARDAVLRFRERWKPKHIIHLGDACDTTAFMAGAKGKAEESEPIMPDIDSGIDFIRELGTTVWTLGNHEDRIWKHLNHPSAMVRHCAETTVKYIEDFCEDDGIRLVPYTGNARGLHYLGGYRWGHGILWNESYIRDSAEVFGNCVIAHGHRPGMALGRRLDHPKCFGVGCLAAPEKLEYAKAKKATHAWGGGMVWGEVNCNQAMLWLHFQPQGQREWRLPL